MHCEKRVAELPPVFFLLYQIFTTFTSAYKHATIAQLAE